MDAIKLSIEITADRRLVIDLPADTPLGTAEIVITPTENVESVQSNGNPPNPAREAARAKLLAAGKLVTTLHAPPDTVPLSDEELRRLGTLPPDAPSIDTLIDEDRGPR